MTSGPRFYNLFPLLCGTIKDWHGELPRIAGMKFDWIFVNPFTCRASPAAFTP